MYMTTTHLLLFSFIAWSLIGIYIFFQFFKTNEPRIHAYASGKASAPKSDMFYAAFMVVVGGPLIWLLFIAIFIKNKGKPSPVVHK
jgi:hypothetical protein